MWYIHDLFQIFQFFLKNSKTPKRKPTHQLHSRGKHLDREYFNMIGLKMVNELTLQSTCSLGFLLFILDFYKNDSDIYHIVCFSSTFQVNGDMLTINNLQPKDFGFIQVFVKNDVHEVSSTAFLDVEGKKCFSNVLTLSLYWNAITFFNCNIWAKISSKKRLTL